MITLREKLNSLPPEYQAFLDSSLLDCGAKPPAFVPEGWVYRDLPPLEVEQFETFLGVVGEDEIKWLTVARSPRGVRGQMFMSPTGVERLKTYLKAVQ